MTAEERLEAIDAVMSALAHATRRHILLVVRFRGGEMTAGEIAERFSCAWPTTSRHLRVLEKAGLLTHEKRGRERYYRLNEARLGLVRDWLTWLETGQPPRAKTTTTTTTTKKRRVRVRQRSR